jgi:hypothetical protein
MEETDLIKLSIRLSAEVDGQIIAAQIIVELLSIKSIKK